MKIIQSNLNKNKKNSQRITKFFKSFSKITYHILLVQLIFFWVFIPLSQTESVQWNSYIYDQFISGLAGPYADGYNLHWLEVPLNDAFAILGAKYMMFIVTFLLIMFLSILFYLLENNLKKGFKRLGTQIIGRKKKF
ncbi:MAG: hypothetical protein KGD63_13495 [Candidatus Lokiarchaeota archaeon]|nr:hypothetical protein [Candidatus Lokiarchaeota archaeon]